MMGVFFEPVGNSQPDLTAAIRDALQTPPPADADLDNEAARRTRRLPSGGAKQLHKGHFSTALVFFLFLVALGVLCDLLDLGDSTTYVYGFAGTVLAAILGLLAGEGAAG